MRPPFNTVHTDHISDQAERTKRLHVQASFPVKIRGYECGGRYCAEGFVSDLSAEGLYMRLARAVTVGERLIAIMWLCDGLLQRSEAPKVAVYGRVLGVEVLEGGLYGVVMLFARTIFIYPRVAV